MFSYSIYLSKSKLVIVKRIIKIIKKGKFCFSEASYGSHRNTNKYTDPSSHKVRFKGIDRGGGGYLDLK